MLNFNKIAHDVMRKHRFFNCTPDMLGTSPAMQATVDSLSKSIADELDKDLLKQLAKATWYGNKIR